MDLKEKVVSLQENCENAQKLPGPKGDSGIVGPPGLKGDTGAIGPSLFRACRKQRLQRIS